MTTQLVKTVIVNDYTITERVFGQDFLVVNSGELAYEAFRISGNAPILGSRVLITFWRSRSWRTLGLWTRRIVAKGELSPECELYGYSLRE